MEALARMVYPPLDTVGLLDDLARGSAFAKSSLQMVYTNMQDRVSAYYRFEHAAKQRPHEAMLVFEGLEWTWNDIMLQSRQLAHYWEKQGVKKGDAIAMVMPNKPQFVMLWLAFLSLGAQPALINYNLRKDSLAHCIKVAEASIVLFDKDVAKGISEIHDKLTSDIDHLRLFEWQDGLSLADRDDKYKSPKGDWEILSLEKWMYQPKTRIPDDKRKGITWKDPACFIYTSGTSGLPKAAPVTQAKLATAALTWSRFSRWTAKDRVFTPLPLYHSSALLLCVASAWTTGSCVVLSRKFSASRYWEEVRQNDATVVQYIGEMARYLIAQEPSDKDKMNKVRMAYGNGMRPDVWMKFKKRFGVSIVNEFYASTEGNTFLFNYNNKFSGFGAGAVGRESFIGRRLTGNYLIKVDPEEQEVYRNKSGRCEEAAYGEPGELVIRIEDWHPGKQFQGYKGNKEKTEEKVLRDVFVKGDAYFRTGDLLKRDWKGFYYFEDRLGDTFRWKGENVSTSEVIEAFTSFDGLDQVAVYGVQLPNHDGRAGCAAIEHAQLKKIDLDALVKHITEELPKYAVPLFIRAQEKQDKTSTEKVVTTRLKKEGVDPEEVGEDELYWLRDGKYVKFGAEDWKKIDSGDVSL